MVTEVTEAPEVDQAPVQTETETPVETPEVPAEGAAPEEPEAAAQIEVTEPTKPDYITREEWEKERREVAERAAAEALEADRRRRQTENARKAQAEQKRIERQARTIDTVKASFGARGIYEIPDEAVVTAIQRVAQDEAESLTTESLELVERAFDYLTAPAYGKEADWDDALAPAAGKLQPKLQHLINTVRPAIEAAAREGYIHKDELPKHVEAEIARRNAKAREGQEDLKRTGPAPATGTTFDELEHLFAVGEASPQQEAEYKRMRAERGL